MTELAEHGGRASLNDYLAAERTLLAWIRTGLALMGFGFVVARFGLFLRQLEAAQPALPVRSYGESLWFGTALIAAGIVLSLASGWHHARLVARLNRGLADRPHTAGLAVAISLFLAAAGLAMACYLISVRGSGP